MEGGVKLPSNWNWGNIKGSLSGTPLWNWLSCNGEPLVLAFKSRTCPCIGVLLLNQLSVSLPDHTRYTTSSSVIPPPYFALSFYTFWSTCFDHKFGAKKAEERNFFSLPRAVVTDWSSLLSAWCYTLLKKVHWQTCTYIL